MSLALSEPAGRYDEAALRRWAASLATVIALHIAVALAIIVPWHSSFEPPKPPPAVYLDLPPAPPPELPKTPHPAPPQNLRQPPPPAPIAKTATPPLPPVQKVTPPHQPLPEQKAETPPVKPPEPKQPEPAPAPQRQLLTVPEAPAVTPPVTPPRPKPQPPKAAPSQTATVPPDASTSSPTINSVQAWQIAVINELEKYKVWPPGVTGRVALAPVGLSLTVNRQGTIINFFIARSSGDPRFDSSAMDMARRARKLPPLPPEIPGQTFQFILSVTFL